MASSAAPTTRHRRVYQACEPCRVKKVRCELGSVDHPTKTPCVRCRREGRECYFAALRNRKAAALQELIQGNNSSERNKRRATSPSPAAHDRFEPRRRAASTSKSPQSRSQSSPERVHEQRASSRQQAPESSASPFPENGRAAAALLRGHPRTYHDALTLLSEACDHSDHIRPLQNEPSRSTGARNNENSGSVQGESSRGATATAAPPAVESRRPETLRALKAWSNVRFVRGGLFTAEEALDMVDQFYNFQAPFSPVVPERFKDHAHHPALIEDEPILTVTMLTIGSRYRDWTGPSAIARSFIVHDRLWRYLQGMISRLFWSEDNFVGEFTSLADVHHQRDSHYSQPGNWSNGFRTLGTCEALLVLLDWHPRSLHFPPIDEDTTSIVIREAKKPRDKPSGNSYDRGPESGRDWLARSDRLCRSMLSAASMLATEIGVFDEDEHPVTYGYDSHHNSRETPSDRLRVYRLRQLIWVYAMQQPGKPNWRVLTPSPLRPGPGMEKDDTTECWYRVATLMKQANELLFTSHHHTNEIIRTGEYLNILQTFQPLLHDFAVKFDQTRLTKQARSILSIEYAYVRLCIYSVALQAVINRRYYDGARDEAQGAAPNISQQEEEEHLTQTVRAAQKILRIVLDELIPDNYLRFIPVRSFSRILGAALFLLKACAAGVPEIDISTSLRLVNHTANGFRTYPIDETSLTIRWGELLDRLSMGLQSRLSTMHSSSTSSQAGNPAVTGGPGTWGPSDLHPPPDRSQSLFSDPCMLSSGAAQHNNHHQPSSVSAMRTTAIPHDMHLDSSPGEMSHLGPTYHDGTQRLGFGFSGNNGDAFNMWWGLLRPSQAMSLHDVPWYPALGIVDGNEGLFPPGETSPGFSERLYDER